MVKLSLWAWVLLVCAAALPAEAQLGRGDVRFSIDTDMLSIAGLEIDPDGPAPAHETTVFGIGPNQLGGSRYLESNIPTPLGLGVGWVLSPKLVLGARLGFGLDIIDNEGRDNTRLLGLSLMPGLTFVPVGDSAKLFLSASPLLQISRRKDENDKERTLLGGFGFGIGTLLFVSSSLSVDLGFHFEGRFGNHERPDGFETELRDLRGLVRLGLSLWK